MSDFHSTLSRRQFMKALGFGGIGLGGVAMAAPVFHDLDELISSDKSTVKKPWYVKERAFGDVTMEHDWNVIKRFNPGLHRNSSPQLYTPDWNARIVANGAANQIKFMAENKAGYTLRDRALGGGAAFAPDKEGKAHEEHWFCEKNMYTALVQASVPKWQGTPEEGSRMLRSALKYYGNSFVGYTEMDQNMNKLIYTREAGNEAPGYVKAGCRPIVFEDVHEGYETKDKVVIPNIPLTHVVHGVPHCPENFQAAPSRLCSGNEALVNLIVEQSGWCAMKFITQLGYFAMKGKHDDLSIKPAFMQFAGVGEIGRDAGQLIHYGLLGMCFSPDKLLTDLPLAPTPPVDAGIQRFCESCERCADICPSGSIMKGPLSWDVPGPWSNVGHKAFPNDCPKCGEFNTESSGCLACMGVCVFTKSDNAGVHSMVKAIASTTPMFNSFFKNMDTAFGYGNGGYKLSGSNNPLTGAFNPRGYDWWDLELPPHGWDPSYYKNCD